MVIDNMNKYEVMHELRKDFDLEVKPYYDNVLKKQMMPLIYNKAKREKNTINLGWANYTTKNKNIFKILRRGNVNGPIPEFRADFVWKNKKCIACFLQNSSVLVFQKHCLEMYAERVLGDKKIEVEKVFNHIKKYFNSSFHIVLPTPTHPYSIYYVVANALFLGDYEDLDGKYKDKNYNWLNTCISLQEAHATQKGIMHSLSIIQDFVNYVGYNPISDSEKYFKNKDKLLTNEEDKIKLIGFLKVSYLLFQLLILANLPFAVYFQDEIDKEVEFLKKELNGLSINVAELSPYGKKNGIAIQGEIEFRGMKRDKEK